jgi:hypothetical protein
MESICRDYLTLQGRRGPQPPGRTRRQRRSRCQTRSMARRHAREQKRRSGDRRRCANPS